jgi:hypothetical protein
VKNKIIAVTSTGLTTGIYQVFNCEMEITSTGHNSAGTRPTAIYFKNTSGITVEFNFITRSELKEFHTSQTNFAGVRILNNEYFIQKDILGPDILEPQPSFILIKGVSGSATSGISIYCLNYV